MGRVSPAAAATRVGRLPPRATTSASRPPSVGGVRATPESEDLMIVKRRKRRAEDALAADGAARTSTTTNSRVSTSPAPTQPNLAGSAPVAARAVAAAHGRKPSPPRAATRASPPPAPPRVDS